MSKCSHVELICKNCGNLGCNKVGCSNQSFNGTTCIKCKYVRKSTNSDLINLIKNLYKEENLKSNADLPSHIDFELINDVLNIYIKKPCLGMFDNSAAFESWILALKANFSEEIKTVVLDFNVDSNLTKKDQLHLNRFLFRLSNFKKMFPDWFFVAQSKTQTVNDFEITLFKKPVLNSANSIANVPRKMNERFIEWLFVHSDLLKENINYSELINQVPVGVFDGEVKDNKKIFTGGTSAIDLIGVDNINNILHFFELKYRNKNIGIISESLFYIFILHHVFISKKFILTNMKQFGELDINNNHKINGHFLCDQFHPLLNDKTLALLNKGLSEFDITFDKIEYEFIFRIK